jgi:LAO/AO transport system kinase
MLEVKDYLKGIQEQNITIFSKAITLVESEREQDQALSSELLKSLPSNSSMIKMAISGTPGVGKSTFIEALGSFLVQQGHKVAVLAIDPSSEITGGSVLGDKTRMTKLAQSKNAFIRPTPSSGELGGVARKSRDTIKLCEAFGFDIVLLETVGVGQSEVQASTMVDIFTLLVQPGAGDDLQGIKRGIMELADFIIVNKADGNLQVEAQKAKQHYSMAMQILRSKQERPTLVSTFSSLYPEKIEQLWGHILAMFHELQKSGELEKNRARQQEKWLNETFFSTLKSKIQRDQKFQSILLDFKNKKLSSYEALERLLQEYQ